MSDENKSLLEDIKLKKKNLVVMKLKLAAGETISLKDVRNTRKEIAKLFTKLNAKKA